MIDTIKLAANDLTSLAIVVFVVLGMLAASGHVILGPEEYRLSNIGMSMDIMFKMWISADLGALKWSVKGDGVERLGLMSFAGYLFWYISWFFLFCLFLNMLLGVLAMAYFQARQCHRSTPDIWDELQIIWPGAGKKSYRGAFQLLQRRPSAKSAGKNKNSGTGRARDDLPAELLKLKGLWMGNIMYEQGAVESALREASANARGLKRRGLSSMDNLELALASAEISDRFSFNLEILGTQAELAVVRLKHHLRDVSRLKRLMDQVFLEAEQQLTLQNILVEEVNAMLWRVNRAGGTKLMEPLKLRVPLPQEMKTTSTLAMKPTEVINPGGSSPVLMSVPGGGDTASGSVQARRESWNAHPNSTVPWEMTDNDGLVVDEVGDDESRGSQGVAAPRDSTRRRADTAQLASGWRPSRLSWTGPPDEEDIQGTSEEKLAVLREQAENLPQRPPTRQAFSLPLNKTMRKSCPGGFPTMTPVEPIVRGCQPWLRSSLGSAQASKLMAKQGLHQQSHSRAAEGSNIKRRVCFVGDSSEQYVPSAHSKLPQDEQGELQTTAAWQSLPHAGVMGTPLPPNPDMPRSSAVTNISGLQLKIPLVRQLSD